MGTVNRDNRMSTYRHPSSQDILLDRRTNKVNDKRIVLDLSMRIFYELGYGILYR